MIVLHRYDHSGDDILFGNLNGYGRGFGILGFDGRIRTRHIRFFAATSHKNHGHQERSGQGLEDIQDSE